MSIRIITGKHKNRKLITPKGSVTRPTSSRVRESLFNILSSQVEKSSFLDLFAGSGAVGCEALSRGAQQATFVEKDRLAKKCIEENISHLGESKNTTFFGLDVHVALKKIRARKTEYDLIFMDPPYENNSDYEKVILAIDSASLLKPGGMLVVEYGKKHAPPEWISKLQNLSLIKIHPISPATLYFLER